MALIAVPALATQGTSAPPPVTPVGSGPGTDNTLPYDNTTENTPPFDDGSKSWMNDTPWLNYTAVGGLGWSVKGYYDRATPNYTYWEDTGDGIYILADIELWLEHEAPFNIGYFHIGQDPNNDPLGDITFEAYIRSNNGNAVGVSAPSIADGDDYDCDSLDIMRLWHSWRSNTYSQWAADNGLVPTAGTVRPQADASFDISWSLKDNNGNGATGGGPVEDAWRVPDEYYGTPPKTHWWILGPEDEPGVAGQAPGGGGVGAGQLHLLDQGRAGWHGEYAASRPVCARPGGHGQADSLTVLTTGEPNRCGAQCRSAPVVLS